MPVILRETKDKLKEPCSQGRRRSRSRKGGRRRRRIIKIIS
jgi:hypothetical protein